MTIEISAAQAALDWLDTRTAARPAAAPIERRCSACGEVKPADDFHDARRVDCKPCHRAKRRERYAEQVGKDTSYEQVLRREYGLTLADYDEMLRRQAHRCAICRRPETIRSNRTGELRRLSVDHDHVTGTVRGLLCHRCNVLVWALEDNHASLAAIAAYIEAFRAALASDGGLR